MKMIEMTQGVTKGDYDYRIVSDLVNKHHFVKRVLSSAPHWTLPLCVEVWDGSNFVKSTQCDWHLFSESGYALEIVLQQPGDIKSDDD